MNALDIIDELYSNPLAILKQYRDSGVEVIGYTCSYTPEELIIASGLQPYRVSSLNASLSSLTPSFICPLARMLLNNIIRLKDFFSGFVVTHTCDPMWRLYDILKKKISKPLFILRVPHNTDNDLSLEFFRRELLRLKGFLEEQFKASIQYDSLVNAVNLCNENRGLLKDIYMRNSNGEYFMNGFKRLQAVMTGMWIPKTKHNSLLRNMILTPASYGGVRVHVNGTAIYDLSLIKAIEEANGFIASDDLCTGTRYFWFNVEESQDLVSSIAFRYLRRTPCPSMHPLHDRIKYLEFMVREFKVQGVITFTGRFCDPILYDYVHVKNTLKELGIPSTIIDYESIGQELGRIRSRVEAFIESIGG